MSLTIAEFAKKRGVSVQRARQLARSGAVPARKHGNRWVVTAIAEPRTRRALSKQSQEDLVVYFRHRTLDHVSGMQRVRLARIVSQLLKAENPAAVLRDYFAGVQPSEGTADGALVIAAQRRLDDEVRLVVQYRRRVHISDRSTFGKRLSDNRLIAGASVEDLAVKIGMSPTDVRRIERGTYPLDQVRARKIAYATDMNVSRMEIREHCS